MLTPTALAADALAFYLPHHLDEDIERKLLKKSTYYYQFVQIQLLRENLCPLTIIII